MRKFLIASIIISIIVIISACGSNDASNNEESDSYDIIMASGPQGGGWYKTGTAIAQILMREISGLNITVIEGGGIPNIKDMEKGEVQMGYMFTNDLESAINSIGSFEDEEPVEHVKAWLSLYDSHLQTVVLADSDIYSYEDLGDKKLLPGQENWNTNGHIQAILEEKGITYDSVKENGGNISYTGYSEMPILIQDKNADMMAGMSAAPSGFVMELNAVQNIRFIETDSNIEDMIIEKFPGMEAMEMPANTYEGQSEPVRTVGSRTIIAISDELPEELVSEMTEVIQENMDEIKEVDPVLDDYFSNETMFKGLSEENMHPGANQFLN